MIEIFEHPSDIGIRGIGKDLRHAFSEAARCLFSVMADLSAYKKEFKMSMECRAESPEELLIEFLNNLLTQAAIRHSIFVEFNILDFPEKSGSKSDELVLKAEVFGERIKKGANSAGSSLKLEVKAATFCQLKVYRKKGKTVAQCVVDV